MANGLERKNADEGAAMRRDLRLSLLMLAVLFALVLSGLAWDENRQSYSAC